MKLGQTPVSKLSLSMLLFGLPGVGKTTALSSIAAAFDTKALVIPVEEGVRSIAGDARVAIPLTDDGEPDIPQDWAAMMAMVEAIPDVPEEYGVIGFDSLSEAYQLALAHIMRRERARELELDHYRLAQGLVRKLVTRLRGCRRHVVITALETTEKKKVDQRVQNKEEGRALRIHMDLPDKVALFTAARVDQVWRLAITRGGRMLQTHSIPGVDVKTRLRPGQSIPSVIENPDFADIIPQL